MEVTLHDFQTLIRRIPEALQCPHGYLGTFTLWEASCQGSATLWSPCGSPVEKQRGDRETGLIRQSGVGRLSARDSTGVKEPPWISSPNKSLTCSCSSCHWTEATWVTAVRTMWMSPVNPQHHEIRNYFLKLFHLLGGDRKLKHHLSIKSLQTFFFKQPKESKGFEIEHGSLIKEG